MNPLVAVVVTYNRKQLLGECLEALARQTRPVDRVVIVDNASSDGTEEYVRASGVLDRLDARYLRLPRNGGGAEGFHFGVAAALSEEDAGWLWLMDDDCEPADDCLERLLGAPRASDPNAAVLAPVVREPGGEVLPINRGRIEPRYFFAPLVPASPSAVWASEAPIGFCSFVGPLVRASAARRIGLPMREMFIRFEDVEYLSRLGGGQRMWMIGGASIVHKDPAPVAGSGLAPRWREYAQPLPFAQEWKRAYGVRNALYAGRRAGYVRLGHALSHLFVQAVRTLLFGERRLLTMRLLGSYAYDGWVGRFRNVPPSRWDDLAGERDVQGFINRESLRYDDATGHGVPSARSSRR